MSVAPVTNPLEYGTSMEIAERLLGGRFKTERGRRGLVEWKGNYFEWYGGSRWMKRDWEWLVDQVILQLEGAFVGLGRDTEVLNPSGSKVSDVARTLTALVRLEKADVPCWIEGGEGKPDPKHCVAFSDVVVDVKGTAEKRRRGEEGYVTVVRDEDWFDVYTVPCGWDEGAVPGRWMRCQEEWFGGDGETKELVQRLFGYLMMGTRKYGRAPLFIGKTRGGKGVMVRRVAKLLGPAFVGTSMQHLVGNFGLAGTQHARAVSVGEVHGLDNREGQAFGALWKNWVGGDAVQVNVKHRPAVEYVSKAVPLMSSNEIPMLPNKGAGMSNKMLVVPFDNTFLGREQLDLEDELDGEVAGIARWAVEGAVKLETELDPGKKWPVSRRAQEVLKIYRLMNNPFDSFLEARFTRTDQRAYTPTSQVLMIWRDWLKRTGMPLKVPDNQLMLKIEQESTWGLMRDRLQPRQEGGEQQRVLRGMVPRSVEQDEL